MHWGVVFVAEQKLSSFFSYHLEVWQRDLEVRNTLLHTRLSETHITEFMVVWLSPHLSSTLVHLICERSHTPHNYQGKRTLRVKSLELGPTEHATTLELQLCANRCESQPLKSI